MGFLKIIGIIGFLFLLYFFTLAYSNVIEEHDRQLRIDNPEINIDEIQSNAQLECAKYCLKKTNNSDHYFTKAGWFIESNCECIGG